MCESDIDANCLFNSTVLDDKKDCYDTASLFQDAVQGCFNNSLYSSDADKCGCFAKNNWTEQVEKIKSCDLTQENNKAKTEKTKCTKSKYHESPGFYKVNILFQSLLRVRVQRMILLVWWTPARRR